MDKTRKIRVLQVEIGDGILKTVEQEKEYYRALSNALQSYFDLPKHVPKV